MKVGLAELNGLGEETFFFEEEDEAEAVGAVVGLECESVAE